MALPYKFIVFDWDGTLMDSQAEIVHCFQNASKDLGLNMPTAEEIHRIIGIGMQEAIRELFPGVETAQEAQKIVDAYRHYYFHPDKVPAELFDGIEAMLRELEAQGYFLGVATSKGRRGLDMALERTGFDKLFHITRCIDEAQSKPHPQMLLDSINIVGVEVSETLMVGDTEFDLLMANNAGVHGVGVNCGAHPRDRLEKCEPRVILDHTRELVKWLEEAS